MAGESSQFRGHVHTEGFEAGADPSQHALIARYCAIEGRQCQRSVEYMGPGTCFLAYPGGQPWRDAMSLLGRDLTRRGHKAQTWEALAGAGPIFTKVCNAIYANDLVLAEVSELNENVLFEVGYSLAVGRDVILLSDRNRKSLKPLRLLQTKYQCFYENREQILTFVARYFAERSYSQEPNRSVPILDGVDGGSEIEGQVYLIPAWSDDVSRAIQRVMERLRRDHRISGFTTSEPGNDSLFDAFLPQARLIAEAEYVVGMLVNREYRDAIERNAPVALLLGLAAGMGKEVLILQELPSKAILDIGTILYQYQGEHRAVSIVEAWFNQRVGDNPAESNVRERESKLGAVAPHARQSQKRARRERRARRARIRFFGPPDATLDHDLMEYFVETPEFSAALNGDKEVLVGRKGVGKSSNFAAIAESLKGSRKVVPVMITPIELEYEQLSIVLDQIGPVVHPNFLYPTFWKFIILTEIVRVIREDPSLWPLNKLDRRDALQIEGIERELEEPISADFSTRIMSTLEKIYAKAKDVSAEAIKSEIEQIVTKSRLYGLERALVNLSKVYTIHVAIDDIDKRWDPRFAPSVPWLRGLLNEMRRLRRIFGAGIRSTIFLREDIFDTLKRDDPDFANRSITTLRWDRERLEEVISARIEFLTSQTFESEEEAWHSVFEKEVNGRSTRDYLIDRTLMRPRDLIQFCQLSLERALRRGRSVVSAGDVLDAEGEFSQYLFDSVRTEYVLTYPGLEVAMRAFMGARPSDALFAKELKLGYTELRSIGAEWAESELAVLRALYEAGFIGIGRASSGQFWFSWSRPFEDARRSTTEDSVLCIHSGFHSFLEVQ